VIACKLPEAGRRQRLHGLQADATVGSRRCESRGRSLIAGKTPDVSEANVTTATMPAVVSVSMPSARPKRLVMQRSRGARPANDEQELLESGRDVEVERRRARQPRSNAADPGGSLSSRTASREARIDALWALHSPVGRQRSDQAARRIEVDRCTCVGFRGGQRNQLDVARVDRPPHPNLKGSHARAAGKDESGVGDALGCLPRRAFRR
jgi:hypothetical protein